MEGETRGAARIVRAAWQGAVAMLSAAVLLVTGYAWSLTEDLGSRVATSDVLPEPPATKASDEAFTALLVGLDSRTDNMGNPLPPEVLRELRAGNDDGQLHTDTIIMLHIPSGPHPRAVAISFPRDSYVEIAGSRGKHKLNSAYPRGVADAEQAAAANHLSPAELERRTREAGRRALVATVQGLSGVSVDRFAEINLAGFVEIADALGGVPVCLEAPVREARSGIDLPAGRQFIRGGDALAFVRQRHGLDGGDLDRIRRQQAFLAGLTSSVTASGLLGDPARLDRLTRAVGRYVVLDRGWSIEALVEQVRRVAAGELRFVTIPTGDPGLHTPADGEAVEVDPAEIRRFVHQVISEAAQVPTTGSPTRTPTTTPARPTPPSTLPPPGRTPLPSVTTSRALPVPARATDHSPPPRPTSTLPTSGLASTTTTTSAATATATTTAPAIVADGVPCVN